MLFRKKKKAVKPTGDGIHDYNEGLRAYDRGEYDLAIKMFQAAAAEGSGDGYVRLGEEYEKGTVLKQDYNLALENYLKAVGMDTPFAYERLINLYRNPAFPGRSEEKALYYLEKGAEYEQKRGRYLLGMTFDLGLHYYDLGQTEKANELFDKSLTLVKAKPISGYEMPGYSSHTYSPKPDVLKAKMKAHNIDSNRIMLNYMAILHSDEESILKLLEDAYRSRDIDKVNDYAYRGIKYPSIHFFLLKKYFASLKRSAPVSEDATLNVVICEYLALEQKCYKYMEEVREKYSELYKDYTHLYRHDKKTFFAEIDNFIDTYDAGSQKI